MKTNIRIVSLLFFILLIPSFGGYGQQLLERINAADELTLADFLTAAGKNTFFEEILIDTLDLQYSEVLALPAQDVVLSVKSAYRVLFPSDNPDRPSHGFDGSVGLSKLFADSGTTLSSSLSTKLVNGSGMSRSFDTFLKSILSPTTITRPKALRFSSFRALIISSGLIPAASPMGSTRYLLLIVKG